MLIAVVSHVSALCLKFIILTQRDSLHIVR